MFTKLIYVSTLAIVSNGLIVNNSCCDIEQVISRIKDQFDFTAVNLFTAYDQESKLSWTASLIIKSVAQKFQIYNGDDISELMRWNSFSNVHIVDVITMRRDKIVNKFMNHNFLSSPTIPIFYLLITEIVRNLHELVAVHRLLTTKFTTTKILLMIVSSEEQDNFTESFEYLCSSLVEVDILNIRITENRCCRSTVHQLNPFSKSYCENDNITAVNCLLIVLLIV